MDKTVRDDSDKTLELGMILMAVNNLVQRCESKRTKKQKRRRRKNEEVATGSKTTKEDLQKKGTKAQQDLDTIGQYVSDYEEILKQCPKESKNYSGACVCVCAQLTELSKKLCQSS